MYNKFDYMNYILNYDQNKMVWKWVNKCERQKLFSWNCCTSSAEFSYRLNPAEIYFKLWLEFRARALNFRHSALTWADEPLQLKFGSCVTCLCSQYTGSPFLGRPPETHEMHKILQAPSRFLANHRMHKCALAGYVPSISGSIPVYCLAK